MITVITRDTATLPAALLPKLKQQVEVDHTDRDALLTDKIAAILDRFEIKNGVAIYAATYAWIPDEWSNGRTMIPRPPVTAFTAEAGDPLGDVSSDYAIATNGWGGEISPAWLVGTWQSGLVLSVEVGYTPATLPPGILDVVLRCAAHLYEYRDIYIGSNLQTQPSIIDDWIAGYWQAHA